MCTTGKKIQNCKIKLNGYIHQESLKKAELNGVVDDQLHHESYGN